MANRFKYVRKPDASVSQGPWISPSGTTYYTAPPQPYFAEPWFTPKPKLPKQQRKLENRLRFLQRLPKLLILDTLKEILQFLSSDQKSLVLVPTTPDERKLYRKCISWCKSDQNLKQFGEEFQEFHRQISHLLGQVPIWVPKPKLNVLNQTTGMKQVTYLKEGKISGSVTCTEANESSDDEESERTPKKPKMNVQKALQLAAADNIKLDKVINLNQSLRNKKKDKQRWKQELRQAAKGKRLSSSMSAHRDNSLGRVKGSMAAAFVPPNHKVVTRTSREIWQNPNNIVLSRPTEDTRRTERLIEALAVPVQSDKATRMMLGMGWDGGALGARGDGITEPLKPNLEIPKGVGFGLISHLTETIVNKSTDIQNVPKRLIPKSNIPLEKREFAAKISQESQIMTKEELKDYITAVNDIKVIRDLGTLKKMQFKVLFLMNILNFVKSLDEECEIGFNKVLCATEKHYMEDAVEQVNMRIKFGSTPAESMVGKLIIANVKDAFLGIMYNHEQTVITLSKYYRFKRLNRPDNAVKRKATVNFDDICSETLIECKLDTDELSLYEFKEVSEDKCDVSEVKYDVSEDKSDVFEDKSDVSENKDGVFEDKYDVSGTPETSSLTKYCDSEDKSVVSVVKRDVSEDKSVVSVVKHDVSEDKSDVSVVKHDVSENKSVVSVVKHDVSEDKSDVSVVKHDVSGVKNDVSEDNNEDSEMKIKMAFLKIQA